MERYFFPLDHDAIVRLTDAEFNAMCDAAREASRRELEEAERAEAAMRATIDRNRKDRESYDFQRRAINAALDALRGLRAPQPGHAAATNTAARRPRNQPTPVTGGPYTRTRSKTAGKP